MQGLSRLSFLLFLFFGVVQLSGQENDFSSAHAYLDSLTNGQELDSGWDFVVAYNRLGDYYRKKGEHEEALDYVLRGFKLAEKLGRTHYEETTLNYKYLIDICYQKGDFERAHECLESVADFVLSHPSKKPVDLVNYYFQMGQIMRSIGESKRGIAYLEKAIFISKNNSFEKSDQALTALNRALGVFYLDIEDTDQAISCFNQCYNLAKNLEGERAVQMSISSLVTIGSLFINEMEYQSATQYLNKADSLLQIAVRESEDTDYLFHELRGMKWNRGQLNYQLGDLEQAKDYFLDILNNYAVENKGWLDDQTYYYLSEIYKRQGNLDAALKYNHQALIVSCKTFDTEDYFKLPSYDDFRDLRLVYTVLNQKARCLALASGNESEKEQKTKHYRVALETSDLFDQLHAHNLSRMNLLRDGQVKSLIDQSTANYQSSLGITYDFYQMNSSQELLDKGFYYTQKMKAQQLWLTLLNSNAKSYGHLEESLLEEERGLLADINHYETELYKAEQKQDASAIEIIKNQHLFNLRNAYNDLQQTLEQNYLDYYQTKYQFVPETEASLQTVLTDKELLVEYILAEHDSALFIFTLAKDEPLQLHKVSLDTLTAKHIDDFNQRLQSSSWMRRSSREQFVDLSYALYQQFVAPIADKVADKKRLIIIGDGMTNYIPFEALVSSDEFRPFQDLDYLLKKHEISYHYSASLFAKARKNAVTETSGVFAFAPVYDKTKQSQAITEVAINQTSNSLRAFDQDGGYAPLPESEQEVKNIFSLFEEKTPNSSQLALRSDANESALKANLERPYRFVHLAGHSFADLENPKFSGIACFEERENVQDSTVQAEDGTLYTGEIYNLSTQADLVTLSSCESGYGKMEVSEGLLGLNRAFIYAGTPNVVFSLWKVYDKVSAELMVDFYKSVLAGKTYAESLRQAKLNLLQEENTAAPHFWGPYLLIGK